MRDAPTAPTGSRCLRLTSILAILGLTAAVRAESGQRAAPPPSTRPAAATQPSAATQQQSSELDKIIRLWADGEQQQAIEALLSANWATLKLPPASVFACKEREFSSLAPSTREKLTKEALEASRLIRQLCRQIVASADQLILDRQYGRAEPMLIAVERCGQALSSPEGLLIIRTTGLSIQTLVLNKQINLYRATGQSEKVAPAESSLKAVEAQTAALRQSARKAPQKATHGPPAQATQPADNAGSR